MKKSFRISIESIHTSSAQQVGCKVKRATAHLDASATLVCRESDAKKLLSIPNVEIMKPFDNFQICIRVPSALEYAQENPPRFTPAQKAEMEREKSARKAERLAKKLGQYADLLSDDDDYEYEEVDSE